MNDPGPPGATYPTHHCVIVVDVASFSSRSDPEQVKLRTRLYALLRRCVAEAGLEWESCTPEDRGDGVLFVVPASVSTVQVLERLPARLTENLAASNAEETAQRRIQLRMAVHTGEVHRDPDGHSGAAVTAAFRLLDARPLRDVLTRTDADLVLIVSDSVHRDVVTHGYPGIDPASFQRAKVQVKETRTLGWIQVPGRTPPLPGLSGPRPPVRWGVTATLIGVLLVGLAGYLLLGAREDRAHVIPTLPLDGIAGSAHQPTCTGCNVGRTYPEQATPTGATTFTDPWAFGGRGPRVAFSQRVAVICRLYAPSAPTVEPGWWYLLASTPWNGRYLSPANSYLNGGAGPGDALPDPDVDVAVPECCPPDRPCDE